ncbi:cyclin-dependent kinase inhibitor 3 family protein [Deinococcus navajonensis]|uniref:Cyclin-dependent kinase inhibitor 3 family protein n=1 Tax=Deinococcus navajonensis TaxID=309884 RepID=A0ABV8XLC6_9DEIO
MSAPTLRVDWIPTALWPGRLGLTFAPGKQGPSVYQPGVTHTRDLQTDIQTLVFEGTQVIAPLIEASEYRVLGIEAYDEVAGACGLTVAAHPIPDGQAPADAAGFAVYLEGLLEQLLNGQVVVVHCRGGLGRAGLTAACLLVQMGMDPAEAIDLVRRTRSPHAIETAEQEAFVHRFAASVSEPV